MFRRIFLTALVAGTVAGLFAAVLQWVEIIPLIERAEIHEAADALVGHTVPQAWQPAPGFEGIAYTVAADVLTGIGFALLLTGAIALAGLRGHAINPRRGLLWGAAGFAAFTLAPALGLPPSLPGMEVADLVERQAWWTGTVIATAFGLGLIVLWPRFLFRVIGVTLLIVPHLVGAPDVAEHSGNVPPELAARFVIASIVVAGLFWLMLGGMSGWLYHRLDRA
jgi:cobalt transporter subunit CbtA